MTKKPHIVVVGGGTAGWITLSYLAATVEVDLTIIHSDEVDIIGVGESTTPTIKHVAETVGVDEHSWMRDSGATFKYGIEFHDWLKPGSLWFHSFDDMLPHQCFSRSMVDWGKETFASDLTSVDYFLTRHGSDVDLFNQTQGAYHYLWKNRLSPVNRRGEVNTSQYPGYSYHVDASKFGNSLRRATSADKYTEIKSLITEVKVGVQGISGLVLQDGREIQGDLYFDCTGFKKLLISKLTKWHSYPELLNDRAIFGRMAGTTLDTPATQAHAQKVGWIWVIPTWQHIGTGYVYDSSHMSDDEAVQVMTDFWTKRGHRWEMTREVKFNGGRQTHCSIKNVIANGLAQSFVEPLEATSIMITCSTIISFVQHYLHRGRIIDHDLTRMHGRSMSSFLEHMKNFVYHHYTLSERNDHEYWRSVRDAGAVQTVSDIIRDQRYSKWLGRGQTAYNKFNWASMLLGYDKTYNNELPQLSLDRLEEYDAFNREFIANYQRVMKNNLTIKEILQNIHQ